MALRLPSAYCDELANCAMAFIVEYPCFDSPPPKTVGVAVFDDADDGEGADALADAFDCDDDDKLPAF